VGLTVFNNNANGIIQPSPAGILPLPGQYSAQYQRSDIAFDYAIAGIPFIGGESLRGSYFHRVYERTFSPIRKDQFDNQQVPGEQSLWGWWLRSQSNFSQGAGSQFLDTVADQTLGEKYFYSEGVDMLSTPGQMTLLQKTFSVTGTGPAKLRSAVSGGKDGVLILDIGAKSLLFFATDGTSTAYVMPGGLTGLANTFTDDGTNYYFADKTGIYKGAIATPLVAATKIWNVPSTSGNYVLGFIKGRLVAGLDNNVYELVGGSPPTLPTPKFTHQNASYVFTDVSEIGTAILVSGNAGGAVSQIHKFTLDSGGALPTLTSGSVAVQMPYGEKILAMYAYIGYYIGIGTNHGFRVATADINGNIAYGPLIVQDPNGVGVQAIAGYDRFMFIGNQGNTMIPQKGWVNPSDASTNDMIMRVDLGAVTSTGGQPFCNDLIGNLAATGLPINSIAAMGTTSQIAFATGTFVYIPDMTRKQASGTVYTSKIRYNTLEPKHFKYVYLRHQDILAGSVDIYGLNASLTTPTAIATAITGSSALGAAQPFTIGDIGNAQEWFQFKFVIHAGTSLNVNYSPTLYGYQLRALPGVSRQIMIGVPFLCLDHETDRYGTLHGYDGYAFQRLQALENITASGNVVLFQDLNYNTVNLVVVDNYKFEQQSPELAKTSSAGNQDSNARGGYIILQCRVIA
jgi:hypothetical protein